MEMSEFIQQAVAAVVVTASAIGYIVYKVHNAPEKVEQRKLNHLARCTTVEQFLAVYESVPDGSAVEQAALSRRVPALEMKMRISASFDEMLEVAEIAYGFEDPLLKRVLADATLKALDRATTLSELDQLLENVVDVDSPLVERVAAKWASKLDSVEACYRQMEYYDYESLLWQMATRRAAELLGPVRTFDIPETSQVAYRLHKQPSRNSPTGTKPPRRRFL